MATIRTNTPKTGPTTYSVRFRDPPGRDGKQTSETFPTLKMAEKFQALVELVGPAKARAALEAGEHTGPTVDELFEKFIAWKARDVEPRTVADYRRDYDNWIRDPLGHRPAAALDEEDVQTWVDSITGRLDAKTVIDRHSLLYAMYRYGSAKSRRIVDHNPCQETDLPRKRKKPPRGATLSEWHLIRQAARAIDDHAADLVEFLAATGWRWSECAALLVRNVEDFTDTDGRGHVVAAMGAVWRRDGQNRFHLVADAKSDAGIRATKVPDHVAGIVRSRIVGKGPDDFVFTNPAGNPWRQNNFLYRTWPRIMKTAGLWAEDPKKRITPHHLRHTQVMLLDKAGATPAEIQRRLGHASITTTFDVYGGMIGDVSDDVLDRLDQLLTGDRPGGEVVAGEVIAGELEN